MDSAEIQQRIDSFERWHYRFDLAGYPTPIWDESRINRHEQRKRYFFDSLIGLFGGSLAGKRVLDLGCNAGFWSLAAVENGCDYVLGVDGRQMHVDQANLVFEVKEIDEARYEFVRADIFDLDPAEIGEFDIVLCLGLMYHISKHIPLMELISAVNRDVLVIDTTLSLAPGSYLKLRPEKLDSPRDAVDYELAMAPTRRAVVDMVRLFGYSVAMLKPRFSDYTGCRDYKQGRRRAFLCAKQTEVGRLVTDTEPVGARLRPIDLVRMARRTATLARKKALPSRSR